MACCCYRRHRSSVNPSPVRPSFDLFRASLTGMLLCTGLSQSGCQGLGKRSGSFSGTFRPSALHLASEASLSSSVLFRYIDMIALMRCWPASKIGGAGAVSAHLRSSSLFRSFAHERPLNLGRAAQSWLPVFHYPVTLSFSYSVVKSLDV